MTAATMSYGIDLGTTTSAIARRDGIHTEVVMNSHNHEVTPSVIWIDRKGALHVGEEAKERTESDADNACAEFKLQMGSAFEKALARSGRTMRPEEMSAEVLKSLRADVRERWHEDLDAAVITVPAAFGKNQTEATNKAAQLAGLRHTTLLQEPTAAAQAYGFQSDADNVFWLVYDFGGGTFDAAIIHLRDGEFSVVNNRGDNHLGGKLIDWAIVEQVLVPSLTSRHPLGDFRRGNPKWAVAFAKLKLAAERAKVGLSRHDSVDAVDDFVCNDDEGRPVELFCEVRTGVVERLAEPYLLRSLNLCRTALEEKQLRPGDVEKVLLVGGTTLAPFVRERLSDPRDGLGCPLEYTIDPVTVVARGAAIVAGTQMIEVEAPRPAAGQLAIDLDYDPIGPDHEPFVAGRVVDAAPGSTIEFVNGSITPAWRSGTIELALDGSFDVTLWAEKGHENWFRIELRDSGGAVRQTQPDRLGYTIGNVEPNPTLTESIGVALAGNEVFMLLERGTPLPVRRRAFLKTTQDVRRGEAAEMVRIPVMEGGHRRADRNMRIGMLTIEAHDIRRDLPAGSDIDLMVEVDRSQLVTATAFVPILDEEFPKVMQIGQVEPPPLADLERWMQAEKERLAELADQSAQTADGDARQILERIEREGMLGELESLRAAAATDQDALLQCERRLADLRGALDEVEDGLKAPMLERQADELVELCKTLSAQFGQADKPREAERLRAGITEALAARDEELASQRLEELHALILRILDEAGILEHEWFRELCQLRHDMRDQALADRLISEGERLIALGDAQALRGVCQQLASLLPVPVQRPDDISTVQRALSTGGGF